MKNAFLPALLIVILSSAAQAAVSVKTSIDVTAEVSTSVNIYVDGVDVTNRSINVQMTDQNGYMEGITPAFHIVGNAVSASLTLRQPAAKGLISQDGITRMPISASWWNPSTNGFVSTSYPFSVTVYPTLQDVPDLQKGVKVRFRTTSRSETFPLGSYSGTYEVIVSPSP